MVGSKGAFFLIAAAAGRSLSATRWSAPGGITWNIGDDRSSMKAFVVDRYGKDGLRATNLPDPTAGPATS